MRASIVEILLRSNLHIPVTYVRAKRAIKNLIKIPRVKNILRQTEKLHIYIYFFFFFSFFAFLTKSRSLGCWWKLNEEKGKIERKKIREILGLRGRASNGDTQLFSRVA